MLARVLLGCVGLYALTFASLADEPKETKLKPTLVFQGTHSAIRGAMRFEVVTTEVEWNALWKQHRSKEFDPPFTERWQELNIDFDTHYAVGVFTGADSSLVVTTFVRGDAVLVRFAAHGYQTEGRLPGGGDKDPRREHQKAKDAAVSDYCFVVLPKPVKVVVIEKDVQRELGKPPIWEEQKRFPAPKDKK